MKYFRHGLLIFLIFYTATAMLVSCANEHSILFLNDACIKPFNRYDYHTCEPLKVLIDGKLFIVPQNFTTDLASIPRPIWPILAPQYSAFVAPAILHDYLYRCGCIISRKFADDVLFSALIANGVSTYTSSKFYIAVRIFGRRNFNKSQEICIRKGYGYLNS